MKNEMKKPLERRLEEAIKIAKTVAVLNQCVEYDRFRNILNNFVKEGESASGKIKFGGTKRVLEYILTTKSDLDSSAVLRYNEHV